MLRPCASVAVLGYTFFLWFLNEILPDTITLACFNSSVEESWLRGAQGVMGRRKERKLVFLLITPRTFFGHASRVFSACNPNRDTCGLVSYKPATCWSVHFCRNWYLLLHYFYSRIKAKRKTHLKGTRGMIYVFFNGWFWCHKNYPIRGQIINCGRRLDLSITNGRTLRTLKVVSQIELKSIAKCVTLSK